jgi:hypothetical protein
VPRTAHFAIGRSKRGERRYPSLAPRSSEHHLSLTFQSKCCAPPFATHLKQKNRIETLFDIAQADATQHTKFSAAFKIRIVAPTLTPKQIKLRDTKNPLGDRDLHNRELAFLCRRSDRFLINDYDISCNMACRMTAACQPPHARAHAPISRQDAAEPNPSGRFSRQAPLVCRRETWTPMDISLRPGCIVFC